MATNDDTRLGPTCGSCRAPIIPVKNQRGGWEVLEAKPSAGGQWVLLRTGPKVIPVRPGAIYPPEVQARRYYDHNSRCDLRGLRTFAGARRDVDRGTAEDPRREAIRARKLEVERNREKYWWPPRPNR